ncbi:MAG: serine/threonine-protein phosphatase [Deltaproteobacteria bacterium]|nr:serine/threonine-protein phosphatase [Deltaproteobacteria bacterium]
MRALWCSGPGPARDLNEDGLYLKKVSLDLDMLRPEAAETAEDDLVAVADGMGGGPGGREAAFVVLTVLSELAGTSLNSKSEKQIAKNILTAANALTLAARLNPGLNHMGSTLAGLWFNRQKALVFNCGDSRVYRLRQGYFDLLSQDHSLVFEMYLSGRLTQAQMNGHPLKNLLTASIQDGPEKPRAFFRKIDITEGDHFFICSDGVWDTVSLPELESWAALGPEEGAVVLADNLIKRSQDNFTFIWLY